MLDVVIDEHVRSEAKRALAVKEAIEVGESTGTLMRAETVSRLKKRQESLEQTLSLRVSPPFTSFCVITVDRTVTCAHSSDSSIIVERKMWRYRIAKKN